MGTEMGTEGGSQTKNEVSNKKRKITNWQLSVDAAFATC